MSGEQLQDNWSSGLEFLVPLPGTLNVHSIFSLVFILI